MDERQSEQTIQCLKDVQLGSVRDGLKACAPILEYHVIVGSDAMGRISLWEVTF